jgi:exopolysaccharide biosynthesis polyprenyl glycosylphosphotransferase
VSSLSFNPFKEQVEHPEWARLIPGREPLPKVARKKPPRAMRPSELHEVEKRAPASERQTAFALLMPRPLQTRAAAEWFQSMAFDFALVTLNWLAVGAALVPLRIIFPHRLLLEIAAGAPLSLLGFAILHAAVITLVGNAEGLHAPIPDLRSQKSILGKSILLATGLLSFVYRLQGHPWTISLLFCLAGLLNFVVLSTWRRERGRIDREPKSARNVLIVGAGDTGRQIASYLKHHPSAGRFVYGFLEDDRPLGDGVVGRVADLAQIARKGFIDEVILAAPKDRHLIQWTLREARRLRLDLEIVPDLFGCDYVRQETEQTGDLPVICLHAERLPIADLILKRLTDAFCAGIALALLSPLFALIALLIKLDSRGPVLYSAPRAGRKGRLFRCHKFRTMVSKADEMKNSLRHNNERSGPFFKITRDPRITRVGHILRRYSLDELPQLLNVLKGEMSLVGPRPHPLDDVAEYQLEHLARLDVTPGITGLWQVTARRDPSFQRGMELDREYIRTWSLGLDLRILVRTVLAVAEGNGE